MAVTQIHAIKTTLDKAISYIENPEKTNGQAFISGFNTNPQMAALEFEMTATLARKVRYSGSQRSNNLAYHMIQSFSPDDDVTPEQAHEIGKKLAATFTEGRFEYVVATHTDKGHIHNHIMINAVSYYDYKKLHTTPYRTARTIRNISDRLCAEAELSVIKNPQASGQSYAEYLENKKSTPERSEIRKRLNFALARADSYEAFEAMASELGIVVNDSKKHMTYALGRAGMTVRGRSLSDTDKYLQEGIRLQTDINKTNHEHLRNAIRTAAGASESYDQFKAKLQEQNIRVVVNRKSKAVSYKLPDADASTVPETALGATWSTMAINRAIYKKDWSFEAEAPKNDIKAEFDAQVRTSPPDEDTLVQLSESQIMRASKLGLLLKVANGPESCIQLWIEHKNIITQGGSVYAAIGASYNYEDIITETGEHCSLHGGELIKRIELQNQVKPVSVKLAEDQIKSMSLRGVSITLPESGIDRAFIPSEYLHYDKLSGTCTVDLYDHWCYSYVPTGASDKNQIRQNITGADLIAAIQSAHTASTPKSLQQRIAYVERKAQLVNADHLARTLLRMSHDNLRTSSEFSRPRNQAELAIQAATAELKDLTQKCEQYAIAARCLQTCQTMEPIWKEYLTQTGSAQRKYVRQHHGDIDAYKLACDTLEKLGVHTDVDPNKVLNLIADRHKQIDDMQAHLKELQAQEKELCEMQKTVKEIQNQNNKENHHHESQI